VTIFFVPPKFYDLSMRVNPEFNKVSNLFLSTYKKYP
jgi:hypothetical protein